MGQPPNLALIKPEEGVRSPEVVDDSKLLGITALIDRFQVGEVDSVDLADTLDTLASIIRQMLFGEDVAGSYIRYPVTNLKQVSEDITIINTAIDDANTVVLTATAPISTFDFVKLSANDSIDLAVGTNSANAQSIGCLIDPALAIGESGRIAVSGKRIDGILVGAIFGTKYYLSNTVPGNITTVVPTTGVKLELGRALNATDLLLHIKDPIIRSS